VRKAFFFEKKKQKTLTCAVADSPAARAHSERFLASFFQKGRPFLSLFAYVSAVVLACLVFMAWMISIEMRTGFGRANGLLVILGRVVGEMPFIVISAGVLMVLPALVVARLGRGPVFFAVGWAVAAVAVVCLVFAAAGGAGSFGGRLLVAAQARAAPLAMSGGVGGVVYWWLCKARLWRGKQPGGEI